VKVIKDVKSVPLTIQVFREVTPHRMVNGYTWLGGAKCSQVVWSNS